MSQRGYDSLDYPEAIPWWPPGYGPVSPYELLYAALARQQWAPYIGAHRYDWAHRAGKVKGKKGKGAGSGVRAPLQSPQSPQYDAYGNPLPPGYPPGGFDPYAQQMAMYQQQMAMMQYQQQLAQQMAQRPGSAAEQYYDPTGFVSAPWQGPQPNVYADEYMQAQQQLLNGMGHVDEDY